MHPEIRAEVEKLKKMDGKALFVDQPHDDENTKVDNPICSNLPTTFKSETGHGYISCMICLPDVKHCHSV